MHLRCTAGMYSKAERALLGRSCSPAIWCCGAQPRGGYAAEGVVRERDCHFFRGTVVLDLQYTRMRDIPPTTAAAAKKEPPRQEPKSYIYEREAKQVTWRTSGGKCAYSGEHENHKK